MNCCHIFWSVFLSPLGLFCVKGKCDGTFCINLLLTFCLFGFPGVIHAFYVYGVDCCVSILCLFLPPIGVLVGVNNGCGKACICLLLCICLFLPGIMYAYYVCLEEKGLLEQEKA